MGSGEADLLLDFIVSWKVVCVKGETSCLVLQSRLYDEHVDGGMVGWWKEVGRRGAMRGDECLLDECFGRSAGG